MIPSIGSGAGERSPRHVPPPRATATPRRGGWWRTFAGAALVAALPLAAFGGTTGKLEGVVRDAKRKPLVGVNVIVVGAQRGAATDLEGRYTIFNVPAGTYTVKASMIGYRSTTVNELAVPADRTTPLDITLTEEAVQLQEVVVTARRPVVELGLTSNVATLTRQEIEMLPVQALDDIVNLQAGVVDGHFRGGRKGEVQYQVDGISVNNPFDHTSSVRLDRSVLEEVQVISGTFDAEYGQAMSGVVNAVLKRGTEQFEVAGEALSGDYVHPGSKRPGEYEFRPGGIQNYQLTLSGPTGLPRTQFLLSGRHGTNTGYAFGERVFLPTDSSDAANNRFYPTGDGEEVPMNASTEWLALGKLSTRLLGGELSYHGILNGVDGQRSKWQYRFNPNGQSRQRTFSAVHGADWTHLLGTKTFYRASVRQNWFDYRDHVFDDVNDRRYDLAGPPLVEQEALDIVIEGVEPTRFKQRTNAWVFGGSVTHHFDADHQAKAGIEWQPADLEFGTPGHLVVEGTRFIRKYDDPPDYLPLQNYKPVLGSIYLQDEFEWNDLRFRAGTRFEYFNPKTMVPGDPQNPANTIQGATPRDPVPATRKLTLAPRLGVSYPVTSRASLFFAYGHFYQMPQLGQMYTNADYSILARLQAGDDVRFGLFGNPDVKPERTVQYQFGYKQQVREWLGLDLTLFYKDVSDLLGVEVVTTYNNALYKRLSNADFGNVLGFTLALDQRDQGLLSTSLDYTWQVAKGNSSDPNEAAARIDADEDPRPQRVYLNWDQQHTLNFTATLAKPDRFNVSLVAKASSGQPYTPDIDETGAGSDIEPNSGRKPGAFLVDLRGERVLRVAGSRWTAFARVFNLFDSRFYNGAVFANTGSPYYSRSATVADLVTYSNPYHYYAPRRVEVGLGWSGGMR